MGNRILKESICISEKLAKLSDFEYRLWVGLLTQADDYGCGDGRIPIIRNFVFPLRESVTVAEVGRAMKRLEKVGCIRTYEVDGAPYFWFPTWLEHQRLRSHKPRYPQPPELRAIVEAKREEESRKKAKRNADGRERPYDYEAVYEPFEDEEPPVSEAPDVREEPEEAPLEAASETSSQITSGRYGVLSDYAPERCLELLAGYLRRGIPLNADLYRWAREHPGLVKSAGIVIPDGVAVASG